MSIMKSSGWLEMSYNKFAPLNSHDRLSKENTTIPIRESQEKEKDFLLNYIREFNEEAWDLFYEILEQYDIDIDDL